MKQSLFALLLLGCVSPFLFGKADVPKADRVANQNRYCCWATIETACRHQGIRAGYGLMESRRHDPDYVMPDGTVIPRNYGFDEVVEQKLKALGIHYVMHPSKKKDEDGIKMIRDAVNRGHGAVVFLWDGYPTTREAHAILIIDWREDSYDYIDSNKPSAIFQGPREWFLEQWTGFVLTVEK